MSNTPTDTLTPAAGSELIQAFRSHYHRFQHSVHEAIEAHAETVVLWRLGDDLANYRELLQEFQHLFDESEWSILVRNVTVMQHDIRHFYDTAIEQSHYGRPTLVHTVHTGQRGRPSLVIDYDFLRWASTLRSTSGIARFLGVSRRLVRQQMLDYGIAEPQEQPITLAPSTQTTAADVLDPQPSGDIIVEGITSYTRSLSTISDEELDRLLLRLRQHFRSAGITILEGMLRRMGHRVQRERIRHALQRIDPVQRVFQRIQIRRRVYSVPGPNALWHHDGQHGLIRWGIVIHGFIDGYSRLIVGLRAHNNNTGAAVLNLFLDAARRYGAPSRLRGDHGIENILVAAWMEMFLGAGRGSYIWGRSVHNVRIERLWVDITVQIGAAWADVFTLLEVQHGLNINNACHIWLLHFLFLDTINMQLTFFMEAWNHHTIQMRHASNRSPADLFYFDMMVHGLRGTPLGADDIPIIPHPADDDGMDDDDLEIYGVDWEALREDDILQSRDNNNPADEPDSSWIRQSGPPENLGGVPLDAPDSPFSASDIDSMRFALKPFAGASREEDVVRLWIEGLILARTIQPHLF